VRPSRLPTIRHRLTVRLTEVHDDFGASYRPDGGHGRAVQKSFHKPQLLCDAKLFY
jgi:hypothetical protein